MRISTSLAALFVGAVIATPAFAQRALSFGGVTGPIVNTPVDTSNSVAPPSLPRQGRPFSLLNFVPSFSLPSFFTRKGPGVSPLPPPSSFPSTHYQSPIYPVAPIIPKS